MTSSQPHVKECGGAIARASRLRGVQHFRVTIGPVGRKRPSRAARPHGARDAKRLPNRAATMDGLPNAGGSGAGIATESNRIRPNRKDKTK